MSNKILLCSFVFPQNEPFLEAFFESVYNQSTDDFDFLIINEDVDLSRYREYLGGALIVQAKGTPIDNRIQSVEYAREHGYGYILWQDSDDICAHSRLATVAKEAGSADILVHDLSIIDEAGAELEKAFIGKRFDNKQITFEDIKYLNFIGFGNMVVQVDCFPEHMSIPKSITAIDWWIASELLLQGAKAKFLPMPLSAYRQYGGNTASLKVATMEIFEAQLQTIYAHYKNLLECNDSLEKWRGELQRHFQKLMIIKSNMADKGLRRQIIGFLTEKEKAPYLWWEKTNKIIREVIING